MGGNTSITQNELQTHTTEEVRKVCAQNFPSIRTPIYSKQFNFAVSATDSEWFRKDTMRRIASALEDLDLKASLTDALPKILSATIDVQSCQRDNQFYFTHSINTINNTVIVIGHGRYSVSLFNSYNSVFIGIYPV